MSIAALGMTGVALWAAGCADWLDLAEDCTFTRTCCADGTLGCLSLDGGPEGGDAEGGTPQCDPTAGAVDEGCGVFVSSSIGNDGNAGTQAAPLKSLAVAATKAGGGYVYACGETFTEALTLASGVKLYGALDCSNGWAYDAQKQTVLTAAAGAVPLRLASTAGATVIHDFAITAADTTTAGGSSIAVLAQAGVTLERVDVTAGTGATGTPGMAQAQVMTPATADGKDGGDDAACSNMAGVLGGGAGKNTCGGIDVGGGLGGQGVAGAPGGNGNPGNPVTPNNSGTGQTTGMVCTAGQAGTPGNSGTLGTGARGIGTIGAAGYTGATATLGGIGGSGQGGGGGGGAIACDSPTDNFAGPSGGGGGAGGCGGAAGLSGQSGGSSIGILALGVTPVLMTVSITTHDGGTGGLGGDGQLGGPGGTPGNAGGSASCAGGNGGQGGVGGPGGGGAGGHSVAVAVKGSGLPDLSTTTITLGGGAPGGAGGNMDMTAQTKGDAGLACKTLDFTNPASMTACVM